MRRTATVPLDPLGLRWNAYIHELEGSREDIRDDEIYIMIITNNCLFYYAVLF